MNTQAIGGFIKGVREARGMSPADVVRAMREIRPEGFSSATLGKIERGKMVPSTELLMMLLKVLGASASRLQEIALGGLTLSEGEEIGRRAALGDAGELTEEERRVLSALPPEKRRRAIELIRQLLAE